MKYHSNAYQCTYIHDLSLNYARSSVGQFLLIRFIEMKIHTHIKHRTKISAYTGIVLTDSNVAECSIEHVLLFVTDCRSSICNVWIKVV